MRRQRRITGPLVVLSVAIPAVAWTAIRPSNDRTWIAEQARTATASFAGREVVIHNVRNFDWSSAHDPVPRWERRVYDLDRIESIWYVLSPFGDRFRGPAHALLSFGFEDGQYVAVSIEARKEVGEEYSLFKGMLKRFELMYVIGDERDLIRLRTDRYGDEVYLYPVRATPEAARTLFVEMLEAANQLAREPAFYGTIRDNCTTRILHHANRVSPERIRYGLRILLPGYSDALALEAGLLDTDLPLEAARNRYRINSLVRTYADDPEFSRRIRNRRR
ncbi:MAG: DUF4105 domain-containing protein [Longimicrobiales bacterium]